jgi:hypothetical protein
MYVIASILEITTFNFPAVFIVAIISVVFAKKLPIYILAFVFGFAIDSLRVTNFGLTPIFIFATVFSILLYEKYSGSDDTLISSFIIGVVTFIYSYFLGYSVLLVLIFEGFVFISWMIFDRLNKSKKLVI